MPSPSTSTPPAGSSAPGGQGRLERLVTERPPRGASLLIVLLVVASAVAHAVPSAAAAGLAPAVLAGVLTPLWFGWGRTVPVLLAIGLGLQPVPPALPTLASGGAALAAVAALALVAALVRACVTSVLGAQRSSLQLRAVREDENRTAQRQEQELAGQLHYWATHDAHTRLLNRGAFTGLLDSSLATGHYTGVLVLSLAGFTGVNDTLGHAVGDAALVQLAQRLAAALRGTDTAARIGGDTFAVMLPGLRREDAEAVAGRLVKAIEDPLVLGEHVVPPRVRAGVAVGGGDSTCHSGAELVRQAEAVARGATAGRPPRVFVGRAAGADDARDEADLARGLAAGELFLLYQPLVCTVTGRVRSVEALVRWQHPERGLVPPDSFIGLAERTGLIVPLGLHVLALGCAQLRAWAETAPDLTVAVNVSARQLVEDGFVDDVRRIIWGAGINPAQVVLELTESLLVEDSEAAVAILWQLRGLGVRLALDDFGTGYSSLARLGELPLDEMKIDKSFVDRLGAQPHDSTSLLTAAVAMGHGLGLEVVAEGVETTAQAVFLRDVQCDLLQGYLFSKPQSAADLAPLLGRVLLAGPDEVPGPREEEPEVAAFVVPSVMPSLRAARG